jgi:3-hydroxyacyl-CoA dehydrogenase
VVSILDGLFEERCEERYRTAPLLRSLVWSGRLGAHTGQGFFAYP